VVTSPLTRGAQEGRLTLGWGPHRSVPSVLASELVSAQAGVGGGKGLHHDRRRRWNDYRRRRDHGHRHCFEPGLGNIARHAIVIGLIGITRRE